MGRNSLIEMLKKDEAFVHGDDGFLLFFPPCNKGGYASYNLREIANYLDMQNKDWDKQIMLDSDPKA